MEHATEPEPQPKTRQGKPAVLLGVMLTLLLLAAVLTAILGPRAAPVKPRTSRTISAHRWDASSPYKNTLPGVKYVGDKACIHCHGRIAETYRQHPMGRSLSPIATATVTGGDDRNARPLFEDEGLEYSIEHRDGRVIHKETRRNSSGRIIAQSQGEVQYVLGSGRRGLTYLINRDGFLVESPITWYSQAGQWGLSPGYEELNHHFDRPVQAACLLCHANRIEPVVGGTLNRYRPPIFQGHEIGCERCHGPGELHVAHPELTGGKDMTIVNPADLAPSLRDAVCEQCHLAGTQRVERVDRRFEDYRPGLPVHRFWSVLVPASGPASARLVGQVEQMHESRCFRASEGGLGCISCHDPHQLPAPEKRVAYYRKRCQECHADRGCSLPADVRLARSSDDDCAGCHMPRSKSGDIPHVATTDHRIPRQGDRTDSLPSRVAAQRSTGPSLVNFHRDLMDADELYDVNRDVGIALSRNGPENAAVALPWLNAALAARPDDLAARQARGVALRWLGRAQEGLAALQAALEQDPDRELLLNEAAHGATAAGKTELAIGYWRRAISTNPWRSDYRAALAFLYFQAGDWQSAAEACRQTLRLNIANLDIRKLLVQCHLRLGDSAAARAEFETLLGFNPPDRDDLSRWFASLSGLRQSDKQIKITH